MAGDRSRMRLIGFDDVGAANELLTRIGVDSDLAPFLAKHVQDVLQNQHEDLKMVSIRLMSIGDCRIGGQQCQDDPIVEVESLEIPIAIETFVEVQHERHCLKLDVIIRAIAITEGYMVESDVLIREQTRM